MDKVKKVKKLQKAGYTNAEIAEALMIDLSEVRLISLTEPQNMKLWLVTFPEMEWTVDIGIAVIVAANTLSEVKDTILREKKQNVLGDRYPDSLNKSKYKIISHTSVYKRPRVVLVDYRSG